MTEPVLVVHGVANHDAERFKASVDDLQRRFGGRYRLIDVFWGDLGGIGRGLRDSLPVLFPGADVTRGGDDVQQFFDLLLGQREALMGTEITRAGDEAVADALYRAATGTKAEVIEQTRGEDDLHRALVEALPDTRYLRNLHDPTMQQAVGELLADFLRSQAPADSAFGGDAAFGGESTRAFSTRGWIGSTKNAVKGFIGKVDEFVGKVVSNVAGTANQWLRGALAQPISLTFGDIVAYHQRRGEIHQRIFETLDKEAAGMGTPERPITVIAHSLGGLACFDAALGSDVIQQGTRRRLHMKRFVTIGSQPAFFHVLAPREGIEHYQPGKPVDLPASIAEWTNLWHPMDVLAFITAPVFRLASGQPPEDLRIDTPMSEIMRDNWWMHSAYWESGRLEESLR